MGLVCLVTTDSKGIKIQFEPDDILKILNGVINSQTVKNFASQIVQRGFSKSMGYNNPYHPEDDLVNTFDATVDKEKKQLQMSPKYNILRNANLDPLDKDNDNFILGNDVISDDALTDIDHPSKPVIKATEQVSDKPNEVQKKIVDSVQSQRILTRKDNKQEYKDDRLNFKSVQKRFLLIGSNGSQSIEFLN